MPDPKFELELIVKGDAQAVHHLVRIRGRQRRSRFRSFIQGRHVTSNRALENDIKRKLSNIAAYGIDYYAGNPRQMKSVGGGLLELKARSARVFLFERDLDVIIVSGYLKAKKNTQSAAIAIARREKRAYLDSIQRPSDNVSEARTR